MTEAEHLKTLIVEDNPNDAELLILALEEGGFKVEYECVDTPEAFRICLRKQKWDIIFSDHAMPHFSSFEALGIKNSLEVDTPFIILSGTMGEELAVEAMKAGASDYFVKMHLKRLIPAVNRSLRESKEREERRKTELELEHFMASLTHDLRMPILGEMRVFELLKSETLGKLNSQQHEVIQELIQSNQFMHHMVQNILLSYKYKSQTIVLKKDRAVFATYLSNVLNSLLFNSILRDRKYKLIIDPSCEDLEGEFDYNEIQRVLLNLIKNAVEHTEVNACITVRLEKLNTHAQISVQDTGTGVSLEMKPYLFQAYTNSVVKKYHKVGLGLGLYLSKKIIEAHGGIIGYQAQQKGSLFYFRLPIVSLPVP